MSDDIATAPARAAMAPPTSVWVSCRVARDVVGSTVATVRRLAREGRIRSRKLPGGARSFLLEDCLQIASLADADAVGYAGAAAETEGAR